MIFTVTHMQADPATCSYDPARGGRQSIVTLEALSLDTLVRDLTGKGLYQQGHGVQGRTTTVPDPDGGRWDCFKIEEAR